MKTGADGKETGGRTAAQQFADMMTARNRKESAVTCEKCGVAHTTIECVVGLSGETLKSGRSGAEPLDDIESLAREIARKGVKADALLALSAEHKAAYLAFKAAANTLKTAEVQYKAAQQAYAKAVAELSRAVTEEPVPSSGESPPAQ